MHPSHPPAVLYLVRVVPMRFLISSHCSLLLQLGPAWFSSASRSCRSCRSSLMASVSFLLTRLASPPAAGNNGQNENPPDATGLAQFKVPPTDGNVFVIIVVCVQDGPVRVGLLLLAVASALVDDAHSRVSHQAPPAARLQLRLVRRPRRLQLLQLLLHVEVVVFGSVKRVRL